ncbi:MAG: hypothetical protein MI749_04045 [Desulfovibrionales bacterium]|nr:hypothetical protein [Desulfovibrionales bacterium]
MNVVRLKKLLGLVLLACYFYWQVPFAFQAVVQQDWNNEFITLSVYCVSVTVVVLPWVLIGNRIALGVLCAAMLISGAFPLATAGWVGFSPSKNMLLASISLFFYGITIWLLLKTHCPRIR